MVESVFPCLVLVRFSGISEKDVKGTSVSLKDVQKVLMTFISADTILIGHELDQDLCALKVSGYKHSKPFEEYHHMCD